MSISSLKIPLAEKYTFLTISRAARAHKRYQGFYQKVPVDPAQFVTVLVAISRPSCGNMRSRKRSACTGLSRRGSYQEYL
jgi:hypothetical protein